MPDKAEELAKEKRSKEEEAQREYDEALEKIEKETSDAVRAIAADKKGRSEVDLGFRQAYAFDDQWEGIKHYRRVKLGELQKKLLSEGKLATPVRDGDDKEEEKENQSIKVIDISPQGHYIAALIGNRIFIKVLNCPDWKDHTISDDVNTLIAPFCPIYMDTDYNRIHVVKYRGCDDDCTEDHSCVDKTPTEFDTLQTETDVDQDVEKLPEPEVPRRLMRASTFISGSSSSQINLILRGKLQPEDCDALLPKTVELVLKHFNAILKTPSN